MGQYRIKVEYQSGDSFNNYDATDYVELEWDDLDVAKENLKRIQEHYEFYSSMEGYGMGRIKKDKLVEENINKDWFVNVPKLYSKKTGNAIEEKSKAKVGEGNWEYKPDPYYMTYCMNLYTDDGNVLQLRPFWCGYFETLDSIEIVTNMDEIKITF